MKRFLATVTIALLLTPVVSIGWTPSVDAAHLSIPIGKAATGNRKIDRILLRRLQRLQRRLDRLHGWNDRTIDAALLVHPSAANNDQPHSASSASSSNSSSLQSSPDSSNAISFTSASSSTGSLSSSSSNSSVASISNDVAEAIFALVNQERAALGLLLYTYNTTLETSAQNYSEHMRATECFSHTACGSTLKQRMHSSGYYQGEGKSYYYGENIAHGQDTAAEVMEDWMDSPSHRDAILSSKYREIGIGKSGSYWVQHFGDVR